MSTDIDTSSIHVFRIDDPTDDIKVARLSPATASDLSTYIQTPRDWRVSMVGTNQVEEMASMVKVVDPTSEDNDVSDFKGAPFGVSVIYTASDASMSEAQARRDVEEAMGLPDGSLSDIKVIDGYPGHNNNPNKMTFNNSVCQVSNVEGGYTTFKIGINGRNVRAAIVDWSTQGSGAKNNGDRQLALFDDDTDEFLSVQDPVTHDLGQTVQGARRVVMNDEFPIRVEGAPIGSCYTYVADEEESSDLDVLEIEAQSVAPKLRDTSPMLALTESDEEAYRLEAPTSLNDTLEIGCSETGVQALGGASVNGHVRAEKRPSAPMETEKVRLVELENLFE